MGSRSLSRSTRLSHTGSAALGGLVANRFHIVDVTRRIEVEGPARLQRVEHLTPLQILAVFVDSTEVDRIVDEEQWAAAGRSMRGKRPRAVLEQRVLASTRERGDGKHNQDPTHGISIRSWRNHHSAPTRLGTAMYKRRGRARVPIWPGRACRFGVRSWYAGGRRRRRWRRDS